MRGGLAVALFVVLLCVSACAGLYGPRSAVVQATPKTFSKLIAPKGVVSLVEFYAPWCGHCKNLAPEWEKAAAYFKDGSVQIVAVDCDQHKSLCGQYGIQGFPTIKSFINGKHSDYQGQRTGPAITKYGLSLLSARHVKVVKKPDQLEAFLEKHVSAPRLVLARNKNSTPSMLKALSMRFHELVHFAEARGEAAEGLSLPELPAVAFYAADSAEMEVVEGKITFERLLAFLEEKLGLEKPSEEKRAPKEKHASREPVAAPPVGVVEMSTAGKLEEGCLTHNKLCVLAFLPEDEAEAEEIRAVIGALADSQPAYSFFAVPAGSGDDMRKTLRLSDMLPALGVYSPKKERAVSFVGAFTEEGIASFLGRIISGSVPSYPVAKSSFATIEVEA